MLTPSRRDRARLLRFQPGLEALERRDLLSWSPQLVAVSELEPNDVITQAQGLGPVDFAQGVRVAGSIGPGADVDFYRFDLGEAQNVTVNLGGTGIASLYDNDPLALPLGHPLLLQLNAGAAQSINLLPGSYEIAVSGLGNRYFSPVLADSGTVGSHGPYTLTITGDNPSYDPTVPVPVVRTDIPARGYTSAPLAINVTLTAPLDLQQNYVTIVDANQNDYAPTVTYHPDVNHLVITPVSALDVGQYQIVAYDSTGNQLLSIPFAVVGREGHGAASTAHDTLATAVPLADLTNAGLVQVPGALGTDPYYTPWNSDPNGTNPLNQVDLYSFTVSGPGRSVLTAEAFAGRIGSPLNPALTLFRVGGKQADGSPAWQLLAGNDNSYNPTHATDGELPLFTDPVLFAGLTAGRYVIAVSAAGNYADPLLAEQPDAEGRFDPNLTHSGSADTTTPGAYVLNLRVQPASPTPSQVVSTSLAPGAVLTGPLTQLTVRFSLPVNLVQLAVLSGQQWQLNTFSGQVDPSLLQRFPVYVQDAVGRHHVLALSSYDAATGLATFTALDRLTNGTYTLHLSGPGGLADLAGTPLAGNDPSGDYLVPFTVTQSLAVAASRVLTNPADSLAAPTDLGVLFPLELAAGLSVQRDFRATASAPQDQADYYQFTLLQDTGLTLALGGAGLNVAGRPVLLDAKGEPLYPALDPRAPGQHQVNLILHAGTYVVQVGGWSVAGAAGAVYTLSIHQASAPENPTPLTTGPAPALQLRLDTLAPATPGGSTSSLAGATPQVSLPGPGTPSITLTLDRSAASSVLAGAAPPAGAATGLAAGPVGVVGTFSSTSTDVVRLVLPGSEFPATAVATVDDLPLLTLGLPRPALATPPADTLGSMHAGLMASAVEASLRALLFYTLDTLRLTPLMSRPLYLELAPVEQATDDDEAAAEPASAAVAQDQLAAAVWAAGLALMAGVGADVRRTPTRKGPERLPRR